MRFIHNPRVYIYPIIVLCVCFFMQLHLKQIERAKSTNAVPVETIRQQPVDKPAEITSENNLPKLYIFGDELSVPFAKDLRTRLEGKCTVMHITSADGEMREYYKIKELPAAILFSSDLVEITRFNPPLSEDKLVQRVMAFTVGR